MKTQKLYCDKCKKEITAIDLVEVTFNGLDYDNTKKDLCENCVADIILWVQTLEDKKQTNVTKPRTSKSRFSKKRQGNGGK